MALVSIEQIAHDLQQQHRRSKEKQLKPGAPTDDIPIHELAVLAKSMSINFIVAMFGGKFQPMSLKIGKYFRELKEKEYLKDSEDQDGHFVEKEPSGIGGWRYANRLQEKVFRELEAVINQGTSATGQQLVNASKLLIQELTKVKESSIELMEAYEKQLIILAEFFVEKFLPNLGRKIKSEFKDDIDEIISKALKTGNAREALNIIQADLDKLVRKWDIKRYELLLAELLSEDNETSQAFNFTSDMIDTFLKEKFVTLADESAMIITRAKQKGI